MKGIGSASFASKTNSVFVSSYVKRNIDFLGMPFKIKDIIVSCRSPGISRQADRQTAQQPVWVVGIAGPFQVFMTSGRAVSAVRPSGFGEG